MREREKERERVRERERDRILRFCIWMANRWRRGKNQAKKFTRQFSRLLTPATSLSVFHGNLPQEICDTTSPIFIMGNYFPHRESTSWNFPAKIRNSLRPIPSFDMMSKFPGSDHSCRRRYVALLLSERRIIIIIEKNKEISAFWAVFPVKYLRNGKRYSSSVLTVAKGNSRATKRCKRRFCRSYRFWDMKSSTSELRNADLHVRAKSIPVRMNSHG